MGKGWLFHPPVLHFVALLVILLALARGWGQEDDAHDGGTREALRDALVEGVHVLGQEALTDETQALNLLGIGIHEFGTTEGDG